MQNSDSDTFAKNRSAEGATPSMVQYFAIKEDYPDALLFFRMGDFYELFFEDAEAAAGALDIALTKRGQHQGQPIPMCGVPAHSHESYLQNLIRKGFRVAICEQMESPAEAKKRGYKSVVKRDVVRLITPGTLTEDNLLEGRQNNYLAACSDIGKEYAVAWLDMSTGLLRVTTATDISSFLAQISPKEVLVQSDKIDDSLFGEVCVTPLSAASFHVASAQKRLQDYYNVDTLEAFGSFSRAQISALGAILDYISYTQKGHAPYLTSPKVQETNTCMRIDPATRRNLELTRTLSGERRGSLLHEIDATLTNAGARLLADRLQAPLTSPADISDRLDSVDFFVQSPKDIETSLKRVPDLERSLNRIILNRGGPRDLQALQLGLAKARDLYITFAPTIQTMPILLQQALQKLTGHNEVIDTLVETLHPDDLPTYAKDGNFIAAGADAALDDMRRLRDNSHQIILELEAQYKKDTSINSLKIKFNNVLGYFIEVSSQYGDALMQNDLFRHRQTLANCARFSTQDLAELEGRITHAKDSALSRELELFDALVQQVKSHADKILATAQGLAELDVAYSMAQQAIRKNWVRPVVDTSKDFVVHGGRHPVVEASLTQTAFIANDCDLTQKPVWLLTGPNMAGKSTFLRQNALLAIMAQAGFFVPAQSARIGVVDQLFSRVGASDDLARGRSTFMVEMVETAAILNQAGKNALVILDEIGRGTATYDGLSIAWATLEHLHNVNQCRTLFATHYHELTVLQDTLCGLINANVKVREWKNDIIFMHEVVLGAADRSYGVQVARLAGLPESVIKRAKHLLETLENHKQKQEQLPLFAVASEPVTEPEENALQAYLDTINPDNLSPKEALDIIYKIKELEHHPTGVNRGSIR